MVMALGGLSMSGLTPISLIVPKQYTSIAVLPICSAVPQSSIPGPLLVCLYKNDLPDFPKSCRTVLYVDDTALLYSAREVSKIRKALCGDLEVVSKWLVMNRLTLNTDKIKCLLFGSSYR